MWAERRRILLDLLAGEPHAIVTEMFPFGRRAFRAELAPLLAWRSARSPRPVLAASVRDILVTKPEPDRYRWMVETCLAHYDRVLVHGEERLMPFAASFPTAAELGARVVHTGFIHVGAAATSSGDAPAVLVRLDSGRPGRTLQFNGHLDVVHLPFVPPAVGHHSRGCESGVNAMMSRLGIAVCASSSRWRKKGAKKTPPRAVFRSALRAKAFRLVSIGSVPYPVESAR